MAPQESSIVTMQQSLETCALELAYESACRQVEFICGSESARQLRLETLILEGKNEELHTQLAQDDKRIDDLEQYALDLQEDVRAGVDRLDVVQGHLRISNREVESLKAELNLLSGVTVDSTKLLTEKLTLARELSNLKPELDHLRSQATLNQSLLAEKLSLQRQVNILQIEVENEKRSTQRLAVKESRIPAGDAKFEDRLEAVQAELANERRERHNADREAQKVSTSLKNEISTYESRLGAFRGKLKSTKELLKETQAELQKANLASLCIASTVAPSLPTGRNSRKRIASEMDADTMIGTPGYLPAAKRSKAKSTMPGEKSTFSITPFLNRTASVAPESPVPDGDRSDDEEDVKVAPQSPSKPSKAGSLLQPAVRKTIEKPVLLDGGDAGDISESVGTDKCQKSVARVVPRKTMAPTKLAQVIEEDVGSLKIMRAEPAKTVDNRVTANATALDGPEKKRPRRKILGSGLGKTLFDEDNDDPLKGDRETDATRGFGTLGRGALRGLNVGAGARGGFGAFSPLKKDRRAAIAQ